MTTFLGFPSADVPNGLDCDVAIQGVAFDLATTGKPGARYGADAVRVASKALVWEPRRWPWNFRLSERLRVADCGNVDYPTGQTQEMSSALERQTAQIIGASKRVLTLGGDHYITLALLRAHFRRHGKVRLLHFDAHTDTDDAAYDHHGVMFRHAIDEGLIDPTHSVQIGIRTWYDAGNHPLEVLDADWVNAHEPQAVAQRARERIGGEPCYLSFDIDFVDPAHAPGTGTPVAGGISTSTTLRILRALDGIAICGADLVEVSPPYDPSGITALAGATIALDILHLMAGGALTNAGASNR